MTVVPLLQITQNNAGPIFEPHYVLDPCPRPLSGSGAGLKYSSDTGDQISTTTYDDTESEKSSTNESYSYNPSFLFDLAYMFKVVGQCVEHEVPRLSQPSMKETNADLLNYPLSCGASVPETKAGVFVRPSARLAYNTAPLMRRKIAGGAVHHL